MANEFIDNFNAALQEGREEHRNAFYRGRGRKPIDPKDKSKGYQDSTDATRGQTTIGTNPTIQRIQENLGIADKDMMAAREELGLGLAKTGMGRAGQLAGTAVNDILNDNTRSLWWLLNAPQAVVNVATEELLNWANPDLYASETIYDEKGHTYPKVDDASVYQKDSRYQRARNYKEPERGLDGLISAEGTRRSQIGLDTSNNYTRRKYTPGHVTALTAPAAIGINAGLGLLNPLGGGGGYSAVFESEDDPQKSSNPIFEVAAKYILGKTGNLLPYEEFSKVRPDVSREEYNRYKAFKYDKEADFNITDGDFTLPTGVLKGTMDGIHGPEIQFLGRSIPLLTTMVPTAFAMGGTAAGVALSRGKPKDKRTAIRDGIIGGMAGLAAGSAAGLVPEEARRRAGDVSTEQLQQQ